MIKRMKDRNFALNHKVILFNSSQFFRVNYVSSGFLAQHSNSLQLDLLSLNICRKRKLKIKEQIVDIHRRANIGRARDRYVL